MRTFAVVDSGEAVLGLDIVIADNVAGFHVVRIVGLQRLDNCLVHHGVVFATEDVHPVVLEVGGVVDQAQREVAVCELHQCGDGRAAE